MSDSSNGLSLRCVQCGAAFEAKTTRRRFCADPCRWAAWKRDREAKARAPLERTLLEAEVVVAGLIELVDKAIEEARWALGEPR